jgi:hypothetical protein
MKRYGHVRARRARLARYGLGAATEMRCFGAAKAKPKSRQKFFGGGVAYRTPLRIRPSPPHPPPLHPCQPSACRLIAWPALPYVVALVETEHHKSGADVFHGVRYGGLNLLEGLTSYNSQHLKWMFHSGMGRSGCGVAAATLAGLEWTSARCSTVPRGTFHSAS